MEIVTKRLKLISCDSLSIQQMKVQKYDNGPEVEHYVKKLADDPALEGWGSWLVHRKSDDVILGDAGFKGKPNPARQVEIGYGLLETFCGMGYATEAVEGLVGWAFSTKAVEQVLAETNSDNNGSIRVLEKIGMKKTENMNNMIYWELAKPRADLKEV